jgi:mannose-1-phosphate guanylyltransferase
MEQLKANKDELDLMGEVLPYLISHEKPIYGYVSKAFWYDVLSTEAYEKLEPKQVDETFKEIFN